MRKFGRTDATHTAIRDALRIAGASFWDTSACGNGAPDAVVGFAGHCIPVEIKDGAKSPSRRRLTADQVRFHAEWRGTPIVVLESVEQALQLAQRIRGAVAVTEGLG